jgi:hypothetical protein
MTLSVAFFVSIFCTILLMISALVRRVGLGVVSFLMLILFSFIAGGVDLLTTNLMFALGLGFFAFLCGAAESDGD